MWINTKKYTSASTVHTVLIMYVLYWWDVSQIIGCKATNDLTEKGNDSVSNIKFPVLVCDAKEIIIKLRCTKKHRMTILFTIYCL